MSTGESPGASCGSKVARSLWRPEENTWVKMSAKSAATIMLEVLTEKIPSLRLTEGQDLTRFANITFRGPKELQVAWDE